MEVHIEISFKQFPPRDWLADTGAKILKGEFETDSFSFKVRPKSKNAVTCHLFAKHEDAIQILGPDLSDRVDLSHYDDALVSGGEGAEFFISAKDKSEQWQLLGEALSISPKFSRNIPNPSQKESIETCPVSFFNNQIDKAVATAKALIESNFAGDSKQNANFDAVKDYGYLVAFLMVRDVVGLNMPKKSSFFFRLFNFINKIRGVNTHTLPNREIRQANELVFWIEVMFGHLFMNPGDHNKLLLFASRIISKRYITTIRSSFEKPNASSLISRMQETRSKHSYSDEEFNILVVNIVMELIGSFQYLTGRAFAGVLETIESEFTAFVDPTDDVLSSFNARVATNPRATIDEALRHHSPTGFIFRTASTNFKYNGLQVTKGDLLCVLCDLAVKDQAVFKTPNKFLDVEAAIKHQKDYLAFGSPDVIPSELKPHTNHHPCFGQYLGRVMITKMLLGLESLPRDKKFHSANFYPAT